MSTQPEEVVLALLAAWNARDLDRFAAMLTPDVEWYDVGMPHPPARGREEVLAFSRAVLEAFPDFEYAIETPLCVAPDGSRCAVVWRISATHRGRLDPPGFAPTLRRASFQGVDVLDFRDGEICRILTLFDPVPAAEQLTGLVLRPPAGSLRERLAVRIQRVVAFFARRRRGRLPA